MSVYFNNLIDEVKQRYLYKMSLINDVDPYDCRDSSFVRNVAEFPAVTFCDIKQYFVCSKSAYTQDEFRAFKNLDSYKFFRCGWVRDIMTRKFGDNILVLGKVLHSQRVNEEPTQPWFIAKANGEVLCGHCNCVEGHGEACSHLGALLYAIEDAKSSADAVSVTGAAYWNVPQREAAGTCSWNKKLVRKGKAKVKKPQLPETTREEMIGFLRKVKDELGIISPVMTVLPPFCNEIKAEIAKQKEDSLKKPE